LSASFPQDWNSLRVRRAAYRAAELPKRADLSVPLDSLVTRDPNVRVFDKKGEDDMAISMEFQTREAGTPEGTLKRTTGWLLVLEGLLIYAPLVILGAAIGWPASLGEPASVNLPLLVSERPMVLLGYTVYLLYSVLFWPVSHLTARVVSRGPKGEARALAGLASGFGVGSAVLRTLGIIRWLVPMQFLADLWVAPTTTEATRTTLSLLYETLNAYAGSVGELLGVSLFAALWAGLVSASIFRTGSLPRWLGVFGALTTALLALPLLEIVGVDTAALITVSGVAFSLWLVTMGGALLVQTRKGRAS
jgi:hypothetical protein